MRNLKAKQLPSGNYRVQVIVGYDENGKRIVRSFTADTAQEALRLALNFKSEKAIGVTPKYMTVEQAFTQYIEARDQVLSPSTIRGYHIVRDTRLQSIMRCNIMQLTMNDIQRAVNLDAKRLSHKSLKSSLSLLKSVLAAQGVEINTKIYRSWQNVKSAYWQLDGLRHVLIPYAIMAKDLEGEDIKAISDMRLSGDFFIYSGDPCCPDVIVKSGRWTLKEDVDYIISYDQDLVNAGTHMITVTGTGAYSGTVSKGYFIAARNISDMSAELRSNQ